MLLGAFGLFGFGAIAMASGVAGRRLLAGPRCSPGPACSPRSAGTSSTTGCQPAGGAGDRVGLGDPGRPVPADGWVPVAVRDLRRSAAPRRFGATSGRLAVTANTLRGARQPAGRRPTTAGDTRPPTVARSTASRWSGRRGADELAAIDALVGAAVTEAAAETPVGSAPGADDGAAGGDARAEFPEGTQALLDRLERLADMRDRGLLTRRGVRDGEGRRDARAGGPVVTVPPAPRSRGWSSSAGGRSASIAGSRLYRGCSAAADLPVRGFGARRHRPGPPGHLDRRERPTRMPAGARSLSTVRMTTV